MVMSTKSATRTFNQWQLSIAPRSPAGDLADGVDKKQFPYLWHVFHFIWPVACIWHHKLLSQVYNRGERVLQIAAKLIIFIVYWTCLVIATRVKDNNRFNQGVILLLLALPVVSFVYTYLYFFMNRCNRRLVGDNREELSRGIDSHGI